ncbi:uncharacterized protein [Anolis sagrei]|uniref:uncharacterized protein n=1 Tax=Anolis sagrei TaxID=38937 RepID=UPI0035204F5D
MGHQVGEETLSLPPPMTPPPLPMLCEGDLQLTNVQPDDPEGQEPEYGLEEADNFDSAPGSPDLAQAAGAADETMDRSPDFNKFASLVSRMIKALDLPAPKPSEHVEDPMFPSDEQNIASPTALPPLPYLLKLARVSDVAPPLVPAIPRRVDSLYKIDLSSAKWVSNPPRPNTVVAEVAKSKRQKGALTTPPDREGRKVDSLGRKAHLSAGLFTRMSHFATYMSGYQKFLWTQILPYLDSLPPDSQRFPKALQEEYHVCKFVGDYSGNYSYSTRCLDLPKLYVCLAAGTMHSSESYLSCSQWCVRHPGNLWGETFGEIYVKLHRERCEEMWNNME